MFRKGRKYLSFYRNIIFEVKIIDYDKEELFKGRTGF